MDLNELIVEQLNEDDWSKSGATFGDQGQLQVLGWSGKRRGDKIYILHCSECAKDPELHGEGYFKSLKFSLVRAKPQIPCGCADHVHWTEKQYVTLAKRKLKLWNIEFLGWAEPYNKAETRVRLSCSVHGEWVGARVGAIATQIKAKGNCKKCGDMNGGLTRTKDESHFYKSFMSTGKFEEGTTFKFLGNRPASTSRLWEVYCSRCGITFQSSSGSLQAGKVGCGCSWGYNQKQAYINEVYGGEVLLGLKFGISTNSNSRNKTLSKNKDYTISLSAVYEFDSVGDCRNAEKYCKNNLPCGIFSREALPDGYTETTYAHYYDNIIKIYENFGGKSIDFTLN